MTLDRYRHPERMSLAAPHESLFAPLPRDVGSLAIVVQGLLMHEHIAPAYGLNLTSAQHSEAHLRSVAQMLERIAAHDARPLTEARPAGERLVSVCRHFTLLHVAMLRHHGVPARARCGFGAYFEKGKFLDHWVTEYWNEARKGWQLVDPQMDARQRELFKLDFDPLDVPRDRFLIAGDAWALCRAGKADPQSFGILDMHGLWFIASNIVRDLAALNNQEMLPWDVWGGMTPDDDALDLAFLDRLATLTQSPDDHAADLRQIFETDARLAVPGTVFNAVLNRSEEV